MELELKSYVPDMVEIWDKFVSESECGTILHSRKYLDYHGERFKDLSLVGFKNGKIKAVFPMAEDPAEVDCVVSHPGISFGGIVTRTGNPESLKEMLKLASKRLSALGYSSLIYRSVPSPLTKQYCDGILAELLRLGTIRSVDLWSIGNLVKNGRSFDKISAIVRSGSKKGLSLKPVDDLAGLQEIYGIIDSRVFARFGRHITHTLDELIDLHRRLGSLSRPFLVTDKSSRAVAGVWCIDYGTGATHTQYMCITEEGLAQRALEFGVASLYQLLASEGQRVISMGRSTKEDGWLINQGLLNFKRKFGTGLVIQHHIEVQLKLFDE